MNAKAKRRRAVSEAHGPKGAEAGGQEAAGTAEGRQEAAAGFPAEGGLVLSDHLPRSVFSRIEIPGEPYFPCNPSVAADDAGGLACIVRTVNYELGEEDGIWFRGDPAPNTRNYFVPISADLVPSAPVPLDDREIRATRLPAQHGLEDARLFWWRGGWWFTASALHHGPRVRTTMALCRLEGRKVIGLEFLHSPHGHEVEKNWMPHPQGDRLRVVYMHHPAEVYEFAPRRHRSWLAGFPALSGWSGGSQIVHADGGPVGVVHQRRKRKNRVYYVHRMVRYDDNLEPVHAGQEFCFFGEQVEFCAGLAVQGGRYVLSFGVKDREAWLVSLTPTQVASLLA